MTDIPTLHRRIEESLVIANNPMIKAEGRFNAAMEVVRCQALMINEMLKHVSSGMLRWAPPTPSAPGKKRPEPILATGEMKVAAE